MSDQKEINRIKEAILWLTQQKKTVESQLKNEHNLNPGAKSSLKYRLARVEFLLQSLQPDLKKGMIVQIDPEHDNMFGGCLLIVTEVKSWGVQGYVDVPGKGQAYYRVGHGKFTYAGEVAWMVE